jgi:RNA polymerase sigma-70 factor, ECF subfamily
MGLRLINPADTLASELKASSPDAAVRVYSRFSSRVRRLVQRTIGPDASVEDLVQDVFVTLLEQAPSLRDERRLEQFITAVTLNTVRSELRRRRWKRFLPFLRRDDVFGAPTASAAVRRVFELLDEVSTEDRLAFTLRYLEQFELAEVAESLGVSLATAKRRVARARAFIDRRAAHDVILQVALIDLGGGA